MPKKQTHNSLYKCIYCCEWSHSPIIRRETDRSSHKMIFRKCPVIKKQIDTDSDGCKYFNPSLAFHCDKNHCFIDFMACLNRRRNPKDLDIFKQCKKCRQFENDIKPIIEDYWLNKKEIIKHKMSIKRREKTEAKKGIKRREKKTRKIIKRRAKNIKVKRIIKRR